MSGKPDKDPDLPVYCAPSPVLRRLPEFKNDGLF